MTHLLALELPNNNRGGTGGCTPIPTMQDAVLTDIQQALRCGICLDQLSDPRALPCQHTFCAECLQQLLSNAHRNVRDTSRQVTNTPGQIIVQCPMKCSATWMTIPDAEASRRLPINYTIARVLEVTGRLRLCTIHSESPVTMYCFVHGDFLCAQCVAKNDCMARPLREASEEMLTRVRAGRERADVALSRVQEQSEQQSTWDTRRMQALMDVDMEFNRLKRLIQQQHEMVQQRVEALFSSVSGSCSNDVEGLFDSELLTAITPTDRSPETLITMCVQQLHEQRAAAQELEQTAAMTPVEKLLDRGTDILRAWDKLVLPLELWAGNRERLDSQRDTAAKAVTSALDTTEVTRAILAFSDAITSQASGSMNGSLTQGQLEDITNTEMQATTTTIRRDMFVKWVWLQSNLDILAGPKLTKVPFWAPVTVADIVKTLKRDLRGPHSLLEIRFNNTPLPPHLTLYECGVRDYDKIVLDYLESPNKRSRLI